MGDKIYTAGLLIIGNEILSGRTHDKNTAYIAEKLNERGVRLNEVRVVPDVEARIIEALDALRAENDYVFTTGGIGPTHDDITAAAVAKAFGVALERNAEARQVLLGHYGSESELTEPRLKMSEIPVGGALIANPVSGAPGFHIGNVYVMAGVPKIMQGMLDGILPTLAGGAPVLSETVTCDCPESVIAKALGEIQGRYPDIDIGSYPQFKEGQHSVNVVLRGVDADVLARAAGEVRGVEFASRS